MRTPDTRLDGLLEAMKIVAEVTGPMQMSDFNEATWKMLCGINMRLAEAAALEAQKR